MTGRGKAGLMSDSDRGVSRAETTPAESDHLLLPSLLPVDVQPHLLQEDEGWEIVTTITLLRLRLLTLMRQTPRLQLTVGPTMVSMGVVMT